MAYLAKKTVKYQTRPGVLFSLEKGEEVKAIGFDLEELLRAGVVKEKNLVDKVKEKIAEANSNSDSSESDSEPKKRGRKKKTEDAE